ncbi:MULTISPECIES: VOC family protein [unclassified Pseudofrankia]|uniref:VOC family protein n=1 Tax=unclassified Pseudofrankia TaxID=2994372 RepID=UPI0008DA8807|nr:MULTISPECIES: VOC family protein [unclassified Pseudofrankia]MDT3439263.1 VOC family protein [Pseudofrankia sp. BMG5.37]OHV43784.1 hypothetical protein BCD48_26565 [Pseudofrankia sp. BMG5.36]
MQLPKELGDIPVTFTHFCYLTRDLEHSTASLRALGVRDLERVDFGMGVYVIAELPNGAGMAGEASPGALRIELLSPTSEGNIYSDHLARYGPGLHHIGILVPDFDQYLEAFTKAGCEIVFDMQREALVAAADSVDGASKDAFLENHPTYKMCYLDCSAVGFPTIEMVSL